MKVPISVRSKATSCSKDPKRLKKKRKNFKLVGGAMRSVTQYKRCA